MTALLAPKGPGERRGWAQLRAVAKAGPGRLSSLPFVLVMAVVMALGMVGLLVLNTTLGDQAFNVRDEQAKATELSYRVADLEAQVTEARSSTQLAIKASQFGMRPNTYPVYLTLPDGSLVGHPTSVTGGEVPEVRYRTPEQLLAEAEARAKAALARAEAKQRAAEERKRKAAEEERKKAEAALAEQEAQAKKEQGN